VIGPTRFGIVICHEGRRCPETLRFQNSATSLIAPHGNLLSHLPYGQEDILIADLDLTKATRFYAQRYRPEWYADRANAASAVPRETHPDGEHRSSRVDIRVVA
jgi:predicted amidohydrolase